MASVVLLGFVILFYFISQQLQLSFDSDILLCYFAMNSVWIYIKISIGPGFLCMFKCSLVLLLFMWGFFQWLFSVSDKRTAVTVNCHLRYFDRNASSNQIKQPNSEISLVHVLYFNPVQYCFPHELCSALISRRCTRLPSFHVSECSTTGTAAGYSCHNDKNSRSM